MNITLTIADIEIDDLDDVLTALGDCHVTTRNTTSGTFRAQAVLRDTRHLASLAEYLDGRLTRRTVTAVDMAAQIAERIS